MAKRTDLEPDPNEDDRRWTASVGPYARDVARVAWVLVVDVLAAALDYFAGAQGWRVQPWIYQLVAALALLVAPAVAYHKHRLRTIDRVCAERKRNTKLALRNMKLAASVDTLMEEIRAINEDREQERQRDPSAKPAAQIELVLTELTKYRADRFNLNGVEMLARCFRLPQPWALDDLALGVFKGNTRIHIGFAKALASHLQGLGLVRLAPERLAEAECVPRKLMSDELHLRSFSTLAYAAGEEAEKRAKAQVGNPPERLNSLRAECDEILGAIREDAYSYGSADIEFADALVERIKRLLKARLAAKAHWNAFMTFERDMALSLSIRSRDAAGGEVREAAPIIHAARKWLAEFRDQADESMVRLDQARS